MYDIQMFTDFVAECQAERLKARPTGLSVDPSTIRRKAPPILEEAHEPHVDSLSPLNCVTIWAAHNASIAHRITTYLFRASCSQSTAIVTHGLCVL